MALENMYKLRELLLYKKIKKAVIELPNNEIVTGEVEEWTTYDSKDTVKVKLKNGKQYLGYSSDIVLYND